MMKERVPGIDFYNRPLCILLLISLLQIPTVVSAQLVYDMSEINGDIKILGRDYISKTSRIALLDLNYNGINDFFVNDRYYDRLYGFLDFEFTGIPNQFMDLRDHPYNFEIRGPDYNGSGFGNALVTGDWNHDGIDDLAIGAPFARVQGQIEVGQVYVLFGSPSWQPGMVLDFDEEPADITIHHYIPGHSMKLGNNLASGDVNGDGIEDLAIGAPYCGNPEGNQTGAVFVLYGSETFDLPVHIDLSQDPIDLTLYGETAGDKFGENLAAGDVNGDGIHDLVIDAYDANHAGDKHGRVYVIYGSDSFPPNHAIYLNHISADMTIRGPQTQCMFGYCLATGNFNGDAYADIGITAYAYDTDYDHAGYVALLYGRSDFPPQAYIDLAQESADVTFYGDMSSADLGTSIAFGDYDGDGIDDLLLGAFDNHDTIERGAGAYHLFQGRSEYPSHHLIRLDQAEPAIKVLGDDESDGKYFLSTPLLDLNADGFDDICIGLGYADREGPWGTSCGEIHVFYSRPPIDTATRLVVGPGPYEANPAEVRVWDAFRHDQWLTSFLPWQMEGYGANVASGDLDADGYDEIVAGPGPGQYHSPMVVIADEEGNILDQFQGYGVQRYGVNVACGDIDGGGGGEIITGAGPGPVFGPHVRGWRFDGPSVAPIPQVSFLAYGTHRWGVNVSCGDIDGDGRDEIVTGAGPGNVFGPHVRAWRWNGSGPVEPIGEVSYLAYGTNRYGVNVSCGDIDGDLIAEIVTSPGPGEMFGSHVRGWNWDGETLTSMPSINFFAHPGLPVGWGCNVACADVDNDRVAEILTLPGPHADFPPYLKTLNYDGVELTLVEARSFHIFEPEAYLAGGHVALGRLYEAPQYLPQPGNVSTRKSH